MEKEVRFGEESAGRRGATGEPRSQKRDLGHPGVWVYFLGVAGAVRPCGMGSTATLRCPAASTARTPKTTLSFERATRTVVLLPVFSASVQVGWSVGRQTTSYWVSAGAPAGASQTISVLLSSAGVRMCTFCGAPGAAARSASTAEFSRATLAT